MKRKLSDLKENECIKVNTLKEAKYFIKKLRWNKKLTPKELVGYYLANEGNNNIVWVYSALSCELPSSDFMKPKKSKLKKVWQETARMDGRIADLEADKTKPDLVEGLECESEIIKEKEIDWSVSGQLVEYKTGAIWMTTGNHTEKDFEGILIVSKISESKRGDKFFGLNKLDFNLSKKEILLKNY